MSSVLKLCYLSAVILFLGCSGPQKDSGDSKSKLNDEPTEKLPAASKKTILFFGNSLTAGLGLDPKESFPSLIQSRLDSLGYDYQVINAGLSGETTASGKNRLDWVLRQEVAVFVLELGANDGLRGIPLTETRTNLQEIIDEVRARNPGAKIILAGMQIPPNMGPEYTGEFKQIFTDLAEKNQLRLIPFLLEGVAGVPELNQEDGIHPTAEGQEIVAANVWNVLSQVLEK